MISFWPWEMWNKLTYERKCYVALAAMMLLFVIGYFSSIARTLESMSENRLLKAGANRTSIAQFSALQSRHQKLDANYQKIANADYDNLLIAEVSQLMTLYKVEITALENEHVGKSEIDVLTLSGPYKELVKAMHYLETQFFVGSLFSSAFRIEKDNKTKVSSLYLDIYIQRLSYGTDN